MTDAARRETLKARGLIDQLRDELTSLRLRAQDNSDRDDLKDASVSLQVIAEILQDLKGTIQSK